MEIKGSWAFDNIDRTWQYARQNKAEVFAATYQQVSSGKSLIMNSLLQLGNWMLVCDEMHHLAEEGVWGEAVQSLITPSNRPATIKTILYMSATPVRTDRQVLRGVPKRSLSKNETEIIADVHVTYLEAIKEGAIRRPDGHIHRYFVDVLRDGDETPIRIDTDYLKEQGITGISEFNEYEARYGLRYQQQYLSSMLTDAWMTLEQRNANHPDQHQMLMFCMSCRHAESISGMMNYMFGSGFSDWIGVTRSDKENRAVLDHYLGRTPYDKGKRLLALVQVYKAGEGFDNERSSVLVFLHLLRSDTRIIQQVGRGLRRNYAIPLDDDVCHIFASSDTTVADIIQDLEAQLNTIAKKDINCGPRDYWPKIPDLSVVSAQFESCQRVQPQGVEIVSVEEINQLREWARTCGIPNPETIPPQALKRFRSRAPYEIPTSPIFASESNECDYWKDRVGKAAGTLASAIVKLMRKKDQDEPKVVRELIGQTKRDIHGQWNRKSGKTHDQMTADDFKEKYIWIKQEMDALSHKRIVPQWIRSM
jgi:superfamily II DNA or RNA helicase